MYQSQINERRVFKYPPFYKLIRITVKHKESVVVDKASSILATNLRSFFGNRVLGPEYPSVSRIRNQYLKNIQIRFQKDEQISLAKKQINTIIDSLKNEKEFSQVRFIADVDPQ